MIGVDLISFDKRLFRLNPHKCPIWAFPSAQYGLALGVFDEANYSTHSCALQPRNLILLYTDGLVEVADKNGEEFGEEFGEDRLQASISAHLNLSPDSLLDELLKETHEFSSSGQFEDDVCLVGMEVGAELHS